MAMPCELPSMESLGSQETRAQAHLSETTNGYKWFLELSLGSNLGNIIILQLVCKCDNTSHLLSVYYPWQNVMEQLGYQTCLMSYPQRLMIPRNSRFPIFLGWHNTTNSQRRRCPIQFDTTGLRGWFLTLTGVQSESNSFAQFFKPPDVWPAGWPTGCYDQRAHTHTHVHRPIMTDDVLNDNADIIAWGSMMYSKDSQSNKQTTEPIYRLRPCCWCSHIFFCLCLQLHFPFHEPFGMDQDLPWLGDQISMDHDHSVAIPLKALQCGAPER